MALTESRLGIALPLAVAPLEPSAFIVNDVLGAMPASSTAPAEAVAVTPTTRVVAAVSATDGSESARWLHG